MEHPPQKKPRTFDPNICVICFKPLQQGKKTSTAVKSPTLEGLQAILNAAEQRRDEVHEYVSPHKDDILSMSQFVSYHKLCRASYTSKTNVKGAQSTTSLQFEGQTDKVQVSSRRMSREDTTSFNIRRDCFICGKDTNRPELPLTPITTGTGKSTRDKVLEAAAERLDEVVHLRMLAHPDLFAYDAKYHRKCYAHYISARNITAAKRQSLNEKSTSAYDKAFYDLTEEINQTLFAKDFTVTDLVSLRKSFIEKLKTYEVESAESYSSWKLKEKLSLHYPNDKLVFIDRPGKSDLVCSGNITVGQAMKEASRLLEEKEQEPDEDITVASVSSMTEKQILHSAAGILRRAMEDVNEDSQCYISSDKLSLDSCGNFVPDNLYDFVRWCTNTKAYNDVQTCNDELEAKDDLIVMTICHDLIGQCRQMRTPITLGLAISIHHEFGSKMLIEELNSMGLCVSYEEVRRFLTSVAADQISRNQDIYLPHGITNVRDHGIVDAAMDNFDQNEETLDGKSTTHAMAAVLYRRGPSTAKDDSFIPRLPKRSLNAVETYDPEDNILQRYIKPAKRPEPPDLEDSSVFTSQSASSIAAIKRDLSWKLSRASQEGDQSVPAWSAYNAYSTEKSNPPAIVRYMPFIRASPSDMSTIFTMLLRLAQVAHKLGQNHILVTADLAIYSKAQEILWNKPSQLYGKVTMRMGGMHVTMAFLAGIGKLYGDGGLLSILTESDVYAEATARQMLQGKQLARGVRGIKLALEALFRLKWKALLQWFAKQGRIVVTRELQQLLYDVQHAFHANDKASVRNLLEEIEEDNIDHVLNHMRSFEDEGRKQSATFAFWQTFMEGADVLLRMIRAERDADFALHLSSMCEVLPWFRAAGRRNYAKFVPIYIAEMRALEQEHPESYRFLQDGGFVVCRSGGHGFNCVSTDQALEQTINREGKSQGGVIGFTLKKAALDRWLMTRHVTAEYVEAMKSLCKRDCTGPRAHQEHGPSRITRDEADVQKIIDLIEHKQNPFDLESVPDELINIISGQVATGKVATELGTFLQEGNRQNSVFVEERLAAATKTKSFWSTEKRSTTATFTDLKLSVSGTKSAGFHMASEVLFRRLLAVSRQRDVSMEAVLSHELAAVPPSLFHDDGGMRKCAKADLAKKLEAKADPEEQELPGIEGSTAYIIDGMALLQSLNESGFQTFNDLGERVLQKIKALFKGTLGIASIVLVFDRYDKQQSIKQMERQRRGTMTHTPATHNVAGNRKIPNYRKYLANSGNKAALAVFLCNYIAMAGPKMIEDDACIILAGGFEAGEVVKIVNKNGVSPLPHMFSSQEEADTRMVLHAIDLVATHSRIIIRCDDTDVLVILIYYASKGMLGDIVYMHAGHGTKQRYIPVSRIAEKLGSTISQSLPASHALTGCDSTSSLYKIGKKSAFNILEKHAEDLKELRNVGLSSCLEEALPVSRKYAILLYGKKKMDTGRACTTLDELRYVLASTTDRSATNLPPTEDAFQQHVSRAMYQTAVWCHSHLAKPLLWNPVGKGWKISQDGYLQPVMYCKEAAPLEVRDITHLYCKDDLCKESRKCQCLSVGLQCTEFCACGFPDCPNVTHTTLNDENTEDI